MDTTEYMQTLLLFIDELGVVSFISYVQVILLFECMFAEWKCKALRHRVAGFLNPLFGVKRE